MRSSILLFLVLITSSIFAGNTGTITGKVTDAVTGEALIGANVTVLSTKLGNATNANGVYKITNVPAGKYSMQVSFIGYETSKVEDVSVQKDLTTIVNFIIETVSIQLDELEISSNKAQLLKDVTSSKVVYSKDSFFRASRIKGESRIQHNTEEYSKIDENDFLDVISSPLSTFAADVDAASYSNARRFIMQNQLPYKDVVRSEEFINYFSYDYKQPEDNKPLSINLEYSQCPWNKENKLVHIGLKGKTIEREDQNPSNLVFLIDVSGSMKSVNKLPLLKKSFKLLVDQLNPEDRIAIVVYASSTGLVLASTHGSHKEKIMRAIDELHAGGSTAGGAGIKLAYKVAKENFIDGANNRVILATDGDFNVGISSTSELTRYIESKRDEGIFLTVLGFGTGNYKDNRMQELADRGNGNHYYIDNILEAKKVLVSEISATLFTIAKDVKIQVEFNPAKVKSYRLIGYENRKLQDKDFRDDKKDAGEIGADHTVTALYEIVENDSDSKQEYDLKYQETKVKPEAKYSNEILTVRIRYKDPDGDTGKEFSKVLIDELTALHETSDNFRFSAAVAEFAMILRNSEFKADADFESVLELASSSKGADKFGYRSEFIKLVERVELLMDDEVSMK